jgi:DNA-binding transcriptional ArsR family regulator
MCNINLRVHCACEQFCQISGRSAQPTLPSLSEGLPDITPYGVISPMEQLTDVFSAISHPTRRAIIKRLANGPARFLDIAEPFDVALNAITKHLKLLERAGLIEREKRGRAVLISLRPQALRLVADWVHEYERFWTEKLDEFAGHFRQQQRSKK